MERRFNDEMEEANEKMQNDQATFKENIAKMQHDLSIFENSNRSLTKNNEELKATLDRKEKELSAKIDQLIA